MCAYMTTRTLCQHQSFGGCFRCEKMNCTVWYHEMCSYSPGGGLWSLVKKKFPTGGSVSVVAFVKKKIPSIVVTADCEEVETCGLKLKFYVY
jgi:hypothetical protein